MWYHVCEGYHIAQAGPKKNILLHISSEYSNKNKTFRLSIQNIPVNGSIIPGLGWYGGWGPKRPNKVRGVCEQRPWVTERRGGPGPAALHGAAQYLTMLARDIKL